MTCVGRAESPPTLRLYQWDPPTISLGYFQPYAHYKSLPPPAGDLPVVRRLTGGGAILHDQELTYSLTLPCDHPLLERAASPRGKTPLASPGETPLTSPLDKGRKRGVARSTGTDSALPRGANRLYELAHDAVILCLRSLGIEPAYAGKTDDSGPARGPFFCFQRRHRCDLLIGEDKVAGSAQRRTRAALLQHGSIILSRRFTQQASATVPMPLEESIRRVRSEYPQHLAKVTGEVAAPGDWSPAELALADDLIRKYTGETWTRRA